MAKSARQSVFEGMELLPDGLKPFVGKRLEAKLGEDWAEKVTKHFPDWRPEQDGSFILDTQKLLKIMERLWNEAFREVLGRTHRAIVNELLDVRNQLAHDQKFSYDDAERALDSMRRLLEAVSAGQSVKEISTMRSTILRTKYREQARNEERKTVTISTEATSGLLPWRDVVEPHQDVATGEFQQAEFAADLSKVHEGSASPEYCDPREFFSRTYLTDGLSTLLRGAARRLSGQGGDPVVELQTNFGGGKTHSMLALYHMVGDTAAADLPGLDQLLSEQDLSVPEDIQRAVLVGTSRGPLDLFRPEDGPEIRTTWGELAWQLGGPAAFALIADNDANGIAPGSNRLQELFQCCAPCLILIDEWVAYLRQIYKVDGLPSGSFDANLSFVQSLTEAVKASPQTLLVASLPASQIEVGGEGGQEALTRLKQTFSRVESSWRPASQEESYEIVRRRLFGQIPGDLDMHRDNTVKQFARLYRDNASDFPRNCADPDYRRKLEQAYPIHPDLFDHLFTAWGALERFQRTRGVLRLMAQAIHDLWMAGDPSVMIMPGSVTVSSARVETELLHYLPTVWQSIIAGDVDGTDATPWQIDQSAPNLNRCSATRRVARAVFMATAPSEGQQNPGIDDKRIYLGVVQPGEKVAIFGDALRRLTHKAKFMHSDHGRYWYSVTASLNRLVAERAARMEAAAVDLKIDRELTAYINGLPHRGHFDAVQAAPENSAEVPDEPGGVRAVVLGMAHPHDGRDDSAACVEIRDILLQRGATPRVYRNTLVFLAADSRRLESLQEAVRIWLAWAEILRDSENSVLDLKKSDIAMARDKTTDAHRTYQNRLREVWCYLIYPYQESAEAGVNLSSARIPVQDGILQRASRKLVSEEALLPEIGPERLNRELEKYIWQGKPHLHLKELWEYLNRYTYLPRLKDRSTLVKAVQSAIGSMIPGPFAYAEGRDEANQHYAGLAIDSAVHKLVTIDSDSLLVRKDIAEVHRPEIGGESSDDTETGEDGSGNGGGSGGGGGTGGSGGTGGDTIEEAKPTRFTGTVMVSADRPARDMQQVVEGIVSPLAALHGAKLQLTLEIEAEVPSGLDQDKVRTLTENANTLKFTEKVIK